MGNNVRNISCASGSNAFSTIQVRLVGSLIALDVPKDAQLTPADAKVLTDELLDLIFRIEMTPTAEFAA